MMTSNHMLVGILVGYVTALWFPELLVPLVLAGWVGAIIPDIDGAFEHRKTLHFPVYYSALSLIFVFSLFFTDYSIMMLGFGFFFSAGLHCLTDYFVAIQDSSQNESSEGVIYIHPLGKWIGPKKIINHAGSPRDLLIGLVIGGILLFISQGLVFWISAITLGVSVAYTAHSRVGKMDQG